MFCLKAPACIHFSLRVRLSWNGRFIFFLHFFFSLFCQILATFLACNCVLDYCVLDYFVLDSYLYIRGKTNKRNKYIHWCYHFYTLYRLVHGWKWEYFTTTKKKKWGEKKTHSASISAPWRALRRNIIFLVLSTYNKYKVITNRNCWFININYSACFDSISGCMQENMMTHSHS